jgi:hypothetical protein
VKPKIARLQFGLLNPCHQCPQTVVKVLSAAIFSLSPGRGKDGNKTPFDLLALLKQNPPDELNGVTVNELLDWAIANWQPEVP